MRAALFGSVSQALLASAPCPVVVVGPHSSAGTAPGTLVCGVDGSDDAANALQTAGVMASALGSELLIVHVRSNAFERLSLDIIDRGLAHFDADVPLRIRVETGDPAERLAAVAGEEPSSMLVVGSRGSGPMRAALVGSIPQRLSATAPTPVMVVSRTSQASGLAALAAARSSVAAAA